MKNIYITTALITVLSAASASAQTATIIGDDSARANSATEVARSEVIEGSEGALAVSRTANERAFAEADGVGGRSEATVRDGLIVGSYGNGVGGPNIGSVGVNGTATANQANTQVQFQIGNNNQAVNMQDGTFQESAAVQIGDDNAAVISQTNVANEAAISQVGDGNNTALIQDSSDSAAASATFGNMNNAVGLQVGGDDNILAFAQVGDNNSAMTYQSGDSNTASSVQFGDDNTSYINQGGASTSLTLAAIDGTARSVGLPSEVTASSSAFGALGASSNAAASVQIGTTNVSAIMQLGGNNEAVSYQSN